MKKGVKTIILTIILILLLLVWAPWITSDYAINKVVEKLGGPDTRFNYLGQDMAVRYPHRSWLVAIRSVCYLSRRSRLVCKFLW